MRRVGGREKGLRKNTRGRCSLQLGKSKTNQQQQEQQLYKHCLNLSQGTRRDLQSWQCTVDISRCVYVCCLVNDNEGGVVLKVLFATYSECFSPFFNNLVVLYGKGLEK